MLKPKTESLQNREILKIELFERTLTFLINPTWQIRSNKRNCIKFSDFAIGCEDYLKGIELQYNSIVEYRTGFETAERLAILINYANYHVNFPSN